MAANRKESMFQALKSVWSRGGVTGFYQGLIPWVSGLTIGIPPKSLKYFSQAWIEASTKGGVLLFTAAEVESRVTRFGLSPATAGLLGGMTGGIVQAYATMGEWILARFKSGFLRFVAFYRFLYMHENSRDHPS